MTDKADLEADYLVVGAGYSGLNFVQELLIHSNATVILVDKRPQPGGHWTESYPHVKLHQPANQYGVSEKELWNGRIDEKGMNKGLASLASGPEIQAYALTLVRDTFLPSGRVKFLHSTEYLQDGKLRRLASGKILTVSIRKRLVVASYLENVIPLTHERSFKVEGVKCIPPNELAKVVAPSYTVLGGGKTGIDAIIWLVEGGVKPERIRWIYPSDYWYWDRACFQATPKTLAESVKTFTNFFNSIKDSSTVREVFLGYEKHGIFMRLSPDHEPSNFHGAIVTQAEINALRSIADTVRKGRVKSIEPTQIVLEQGTIPADPDTLYVDCTAFAFPTRPLVPVFQPGKITIQIIRQPLVPYSAAKIGFLESLNMSDEEKNKYAKPIPMQRSIDQWLLGQQIDFENRISEMEHPKLRKWMESNRLGTLEHIIANVGWLEFKKLFLLKKMQVAFMAAHKHMPDLIATIEPVVRENLGYGAWGADATKAKNHQSGS